MLGKLPAHIMEQTKDNLGGKPRGGKRAGADTMVDPITGETIENVFKRAPVKNPGSRKTRKIVTEEILGDEDEDIGDEPEDDLEAAE
jgi:multidrug efflux pump subunit AcrA (membrane-fusion protein)